jgi:hypothetical protein
MGSSGSKKGVGPMKTLFTAVFGALLLSAPVIASAAAVSNSATEPHAGRAAVSSASAPYVNGRSRSWTSILNYQDGVHLTPSVPLARSDPPNWIAQQNGVTSLLNQTGGR